MHMDTRTITSDRGPPAHACRLCGVRTPLLHVHVISCHRPGRLEGRCGVLLTQLHHFAWGKRDSDATATIEIPFSSRQSRLLLNIVQLFQLGPLWPRVTIQSHSCRYARQPEEMAPEETRVSLQEAERRALAGRVESQDSQLVAVEMYRRYGIGLRSSSPIQPLPLPLDEVLSIYQDQLRAPRPPKVHQGFNGTFTKPNPEATSPPPAKPRGRSKKKVGPAAAATPTPTAGKGKDKGKGYYHGLAAANLDLCPGPARPTDASNNRVSLHHHLSLKPPTSAYQISDFETATPVSQSDSLPTNSWRQYCLDGPLLSTIVNPAVLTPSIARDDDDHHHKPSLSSQSSTAALSEAFTKRRRTEKMESSQSPTQSNDGRSYEQYEQYHSRGDDLISSDPIQIEYLSQPSVPSSPTSKTNENTTLEHGDTGAVDFDFSALARQDTQISVPDSLRLTANPETPAPPKNPFAGSKAALMASSQMFTHTQLSSAHKNLSPTSSRPSPDNLHLNALNSISPNPSPIKRATLGPSPLQGALSSLPESPIALDTSPQQARDCLDLEGDRNVRQKKNAMHFPFPSRRATAEVYKPTHQSLDRRRKEIEPSAQSESENEWDEDISDEEARRRQRHRALLKNAAGSRCLQAISSRYPDDARDDVVPSTTREEESYSPGPAAKRYLEQCEGFSARDSQNSIEDTQGIEDSQVVQLSAGVLEDKVAAQVEPQPTENTSSNDGVVPNTDPGPVTSALTAPAHDPAIPETSPTNLKLRALGDMMPASSEADASGAGSFAKLLGSSFPAESASQATTSSGRNLELLIPDIQSSPPSPSAPAERSSRYHGDQDNGADGLGSLSSGVRSSPTAPAFSTRARLRGAQRQSLTTVPPTSPSRPASSVSTLSKLTTTPDISVKLSPPAGESPRSALTPSSTDEVKSSPAVAKAERRKKLSTAAKKTPQIAGTRTSKRRAGRYFASNVSGSTDEMAQSPSTSTPIFEHSTRLPRLGRASSQEPPTPYEISRGGKIFAGMSFAISFQSKQQGEKEPHYDSRMALSSQISNKIKQGGGKVLVDGFEKLFDFCPVKNAERNRETASSTPCPDEEIKLAPAAREAGFTALIADGHSRKVKYMQALALGLPCIHERWITTCVEKQRLVDWSDYLLCAGNSSFLGDAIRSRNLSVYDAASAKLSQVIEGRPRLLARSRILLVMSRADESKKAAYVFLARVLGASLSRVYNLDEARQQLKSREDAGHPYDWVYIDEKMPSRADLFAGPRLPPPAVKKRKRKSEVNALTVPPPKRIRTLSDELVIQSLILGRLMEEEEMP